jgi:hypothetical protein
MLAGMTKDIERLSSSPAMKTGVVIGIFSPSALAPLMYRKSRWKLVPESPSIAVSTILRLGFAALARGFASGEENCGGEYREKNGNEGFHFKKVGRNSPLANFDKYLKR